MIDTNRLIGVPYLRNGRDPSDGLDCWGLVSHVLRLLGTPVPRDWSAQDDAEGRHLIGEQLRSGEWEETIGGVGHVAVMLRRRWAVHVGICVPGGILHTSKATGAVMQPARRVMRQQGFSEIRFYRWVGVDAWA